ncbi:helix-turn-helix domain-containing protein [Nocardiopsis composta]|uniref:AraC-like DNA-binding protein n=1 Tax=Nocardiopsis composta TaxID=157465 RepID=A0A7W8QSS7_9ACTN|nr:helix-turn-helix domain-containing protein [Nocardiopsis composta]MBB5435928.1 AraC-like DNA-binding protein [Nocardiopsis composta]
MDAAVQTASVEAAARAPHPALRRHVPLYRGYRYSAGAAVWRREPPAGSVTVIVNLGGRFRAGWVGSAGPAFEVAPVSSFISGMHDRAAYTLDGGEQYGVEFEPTPTGAYALFGLPLRELAGEIVPLEEVLGPQARGLVERMAEALGWAERFDLLDAALLDRARHPAAVHPMVARAWEVLASSDGRATVTELCRETGYGRRHLTARFHDQLGLAPKAAARVLRFRSALGLVLSGRPLAEAAAACGYHDQPHLTREWRDLTGCTPAELRAEMLADATVAAMRRPD